MQGPIQPGWPFCVRPRPDCPTVRPGPAGMSVGRHPHQMKMFFEGIVRVGSTCCNKLNRGCRAAAVGLRRERGKTRASYGKRAIESQSISTRSGQWRHGTGGIAVRGGGAFSDEEIQLLRGLPAVANVTRNRITYSDAFKQVCTIRYLAGESPTKIFREAGLPPDLVGYKRIERSVARWKADAIKSVSGNDHLDDSEIIAQLVERCKRTLVTRRNLDNIASDVPDSSVPVMSEGAVGAYVSIGALDGDTAGIIIKQQARRIDELERANASLLDKLDKAIPSSTVAN